MFGELLGCTKKLGSVEMNYVNNNIQMQKWYISNSQESPIEMVQWNKPKDLWYRENKEFLFLFCEKEKGITYPFNCKVGLRLDQQQYHGINRITAIMYAPMEFLLELICFDETRREDPAVLVYQYKKLSEMRHNLWYKRDLVLNTGRNYVPMLLSFQAFEADRKQYKMLLVQEEEEKGKNKKRKREEDKGIRWRYVFNLWMQSWFGTWKIRSIRRGLKLSIWLPLGDYQMVRYSRFWHEDSVFNMPMMLKIDEKGWINVIHPTNWNSNSMYDLKVSFFHYLLFLQNSFEIGYKLSMRNRISKKLVQYIGKRRWNYRAVIYQLIHEKSKQLGCRFVWRKIFSYLGCYNYNREGEKWYSSSKNYLYFNPMNPYHPRWYGIYINGHVRDHRKKGEVVLENRLARTHRYTIYWSGIQIEMAKEPQNIEPVQGYSLYFPGAHSGKIVYVFCIMI